MAMAKSIARTCRISRCAISCLAGPPLILMHRDYGGRNRGVPARKVEIELQRVNDSNLLVIPRHEEKLISEPDSCGYTSSGDIADSPHSICLQKREPAASSTVPFSAIQMMVGLLNA